MATIDRYQEDRIRLALAWLVLAIGLGLGAFLLALTGPANAASPQYCAFYAREYVKQFDLGATQAAATIEIGDEAYYRCLNMDTAPPLPDLSAYAGSGFDGVDLAEPLFSQGDTDFEDTVAEPETVAEAEPAPEPEIAAAVEPEPTRTASRPAQRSRSGLAPWSPEWRAWCETHFPNSFDPETGSVIAFEGGRGFC